MNRIIQILIKNHVFLLFIILEFISFQLLIANNFVVESGFFQKMTEIRSSIFIKEQSIKDYFILKQHNAELLNNNKFLFSQNQILKQKLEFKTQNNNELMLESKFPIQAKVVKNSWRKKQNFITIDKGESSGVKTNMGVINNYGLVGITHTVSENFSTIISVINTDLMISAKIKDSGNFGTLTWDGKDPKTLKLVGLPKHVDLKIGDTVITSGYSNILNEEIKIGAVSKYKAEKNTNFLDINVVPFVDFTNIYYTYVLEGNHSEERLLIENESSN
tara:strand:- start:1020 stop:1844 length:825 start_codon:yes stop_codon:yes gene_type:complete